MTAPTIPELRQLVTGDVIGRDDPGYDEARRVYNAMIDRRPSVVVQCANAADVVAAVNHARENGLDLAIRGGGHSDPGFGTIDDGVVVVDLSGMRSATVDPATRRPALRVALRGATSMRSDVLRRQGCRHDPALQP